MCHCEAVRNTLTNIQVSQTSKTCSHARNNWGTWRGHNFQLVQRKLSYGLLKAWRASRPTNRLPSDQKDCKAQNRSQIVNLLDKAKRYAKNLGCARLFEDWRCGTSFQGSSSRRRSSNTFLSLRGKICSCNVSFQRRIACCFKDDTSKARCREQQASACKFQYVGITWPTKGIEEAQGLEWFRHVPCRGLKFRVHGLRFGI